MNNITNLRHGLLEKRHFLYVSKFLLIPLTYQINYQPSKNENEKMHFSVPAFQTKNFFLLFDNISISKCNYEIVTQSLKACIQKLIFTRLTMKSEAELADSTIE